MALVGWIVDWLAWLVVQLSRLPGRALNSAATRAAGIRDDWLSGPVAVAHKRSWFQRFLTWGSRRPGWFTLFMAVAAALIALEVHQLIGTCLARTSWCSHVPTLKDDFDFPAFIGAPWGAQATLVGLVYPVVISFVALMLQRRAHSATALRLYALESAVIPAGASSIGLLAVLSLEYFAALHGSEHKTMLILPVLAFDATWFLTNLALTAYFLTKTIRFLQEDEQPLISRRLAIDVVLRQELVASIAQHIVGHAPQKVWRQPADGGRTGGVQTVFWKAETRPQVEHNLKAGQVIVDVRLRLLSWVRWSWLRRAAPMFKDAKPWRQPTLNFCLPGQTLEAGRLSICGVTNGPSLHWWEKQLVRFAYEFRQGHDVPLGLSTERMMRELAIEAQSHFDEGRYELAIEVGLEQVALHKALVNACAFDADGTPDNAALAPSIEASCGGVATIRINGTGS